MDVLEYWHPQVDGSCFERGPLSEKVWERLQNIVLLCHAHRHWQHQANERRRSPIPRPLYGDRESAYARRKRKQEWQSSIDRCETHMYRAAYLVTEQMSA